MRHINIPVFIPHLGCPNQCIFCNQRYISGTQKFDESQVDEIINSVLSTTTTEDECEIAFFGGSFTGIDRDLMIRLLNKAQGYVDKGQAIGIRLSTRPDYISEEILEILKKYTIICVELGIQSMNDNVLKFLKRGHCVSDTYKAARLLNEYDIKFAGQMMVGLPTATIDDEIDCARQICALGATGTRIYPTLVFKNTELELITKNNEYYPLSLEEAIERSAQVYEIFIQNNVKCYRIGLCESENLHSENTYFAGPSSASIGEMVKSRIYLNRIVSTIQKNGLDKVDALYIECSLGKKSQIIGNKKSNIAELKNRFGYKNIKVSENPTLKDFQIKLKEKEESQCV